MMRFSRPDGYRLEMLVHLGNRIAYIATALQVDDLDGKHVRARVHAANEA